jgi:hypothetical protein
MEGSFNSAGLKGLEGLEGDSRREEGETKIYTRPKP